jgi:hypothetical protein
MCTYAALNYVDGFRSVVTDGKHSSARAGNEMSGCVVASACITTDGRKAWARHSRRAHTCASLLVASAQMPPGLPALLLTALVGLLLLNNTEFVPTRVGPNVAPFVLCRATVAARTQCALLEHPASVQLPIVPPTAV